MWKPVCVCTLTFLLPSGNKHNGISAEILVPLEFMMIIILTVCNCSKRQDQYK